MLHVVVKLVNEWIVDSANRKLLACHQKYFSVHTETHPSTCPPTDFKHSENLETFEFVETKSCCFFF